MNIVNIAKKLLAVIILLSFVVLFSSVVVINTIDAEHMGHGCHTGRDVRNVRDIQDTQDTQDSSCSVCALLKQAEQLFRAVAIAFIVTAVIFFAVEMAVYDSRKGYSASLVGCKVRMNN